MNIPHFYVSSARVTTRLPSILLDAIQKHGKGISLLLSLFPPPIFSYLLSSQMFSSSHLLIVEDSSVVVQKNSFSKPGKLSCSLSPSSLLSPPITLCSTLRSAFPSFQLKHVAEMVTTLAGSSEGRRDGKGSDALFQAPWGMCINPHDQCLYICDSGNNSIRKLTMQGISFLPSLPPLPSTSQIHIR